MIKTQRTSRAHYAIQRYCAVILSLAIVATVAEGAIILARALAMR